MFGDMVDFMSGSDGPNDINTQGAEASQRYAGQMIFDAGQQNMGEWQDMYRQIREDFAPWRDLGQWATAELGRKTRSGALELPRFAPPSAEEARRTPGYQFRQQEGTKALDRRINAGGMHFSGAAIKAGQRYSQNVASNEYDKVFSRAVGEYEMDINNRLNDRGLMTNLAQMGVGATQGTANAGAMMTRGVTDARMVGNRALGAGAIGAENVAMQGEIYNNQLAARDQDMFMDFLGSMTGMAAASMAGGGGSGVGAGAGQGVRIP